MNYDIIKKFKNITQTDYNTFAKKKKILKIIGMYETGKIDINECYLHLQD